MEGPFEGHPLQLEMFVIYERPKDYPDHYVMRRWGSRDGDHDEFRLAATLEEIRRFAPPHCVRIPRDPSDEPQIVESWI